MEDMFHKLNRQPLTLILAEVRFSKVLKMGESIPDIQDRLRRQYPLFDPSSEQMIEVRNDGVRLGEGLNKWTFISADRTQAIVIDEDRFVFLSTTYKRFPDFKKQCMLALSVVEEIVSPGLLLRVGLRYNDSVVPGEDEQLEQYIEAPWIPPKPLDSLSKGLGYHKEETVIRTNFGALSVRTMVGKSELRVMPDLVGAAVEINNDVPTDRITAILDFDHHWQAGKKSIEFSTKQAGDILDNLHTIAREAFWKTTTDFARNEKWG